MKPKRKLNRNKLFVREKPDLPRLQFIERATGRVVEIELACGDDKSQMNTKDKKYDHSTRHPGNRLAA